MEYIVFVSVKSEKLEKNGEENFSLPPLKIIFTLYIVS